MINPTNPANPRQKTNPQVSKFDVKEVLPPPELLEGGSYGLVTITPASRYFAGKLAPKEYSV
jgi:hypothetical protein